MKKRGEAHQYLVDHKLSRTHWGRRIVAAEKRGAFWSEDWTDAGEWTTCACGRQDERIPRAGEQPNDGALFDLGMRFYACVKHENYLDAARILHNIERRSAEVLREVLRGAK